MKRREVLTDFGTPVFGNDTKEQEHLRNIARIAQLYVDGEVDRNVLFEALVEYTRYRRTKRKN